jgi:hypothetical protein
VVGEECAAMSHVLGFCGREVWGGEVVVGVFV